MSQYETVMYMCTCISFAELQLQPYHFYTLEVLFVLKILL